jgi:GAF domain-containing protein
MPRGAKDAKPAKAKVEAKLPATRKSRKNEGSSVGDLENRLAKALKREAEALEQQTATAEILRVISSSPTDVQPVFATVLTSAARLCEAFDATILRVDGDVLRIVAHEGPIPTTPVGALPLIRGTAAGRSVLDRRTIHIPDLQAEVDEYPESSVFARSYGFRTVLNVPLLRGAKAIGTISIRRTEIRPFTDKQIKLLETFADQAVIAIENVRLFQELQARNQELTEALEQQTATAEILRVISSSPTDAQPVFDTIVRSAVRLCDAVQSNVQLFDGELMHWVAQQNIRSEAMDLIRRLYPMRPDRSQTASRAVLARRVVHLPDVLDDREYRRELALSGGWRSLLSVPMIREGDPIGAITVARHKPGAFSETQIALLQTFADQAVIAIENVRLFQELQVRNRDLTEALEQQTVTAGILRVISSSPTDVHPVFDTIVKNVVRLCDAVYSTVFRVDEGRLDLVAHHNIPPEGLEELRRRYPAPLSVNTGSAQAARERVVVQISDVENNPTVTEDRRRLARIVGYRSQAWVPMLKGDRTLGVIGVSRREAEAFPAQHIALLQTFADQAVIAIENVRLFQELQVRNRELTRALDQQTAAAEILRAISGSPTDVQPVFDAIVRSAVRLCGGVFSIVLRFDGELIHFVAHHNFSPGALTAYRQWFPRRATDDRLVGRAIVERRVMNVPDVTTEFRFVPGQREDGFRSVLFVPMLRDGVSIGVIGVSRIEVGAFPEDQVQLLQTFADQAVIAIENVRLFTELQEKNRALTQAHAQVTEALEQQTATADVLKVISRSTFDLQPVLETLIESAVRLCGADKGFILRPDGDLYRPAVAYGATPEFIEIARRNPIRPGRESATGRAVLERRVIHIPDVLADPEYGWATGQRGEEIRTILAVPMLREATVIGVIVIRRTEVQPFTDKQIELVKTFADQAVIAIENVRLFKELEARNRDLTETLEQQTATADILRVIASSPTDLQPVFDAIAQGAMRLCRASSGGVSRFDGELVHLAALANVSPESAAAVRSVFPMPPSRRTAAARAILTGGIAHIPDVVEDPEYGIATQAQAAFRSVVSVPMLHKGKAIGAVAVGRPHPGPFSERQISLLQTFAHQAVIAIENVRLFKELEARTQDLTRSVGELRALGDVGRALSSTLDLDMVLQTIVTRASQLAETDACSVFEYDEATEGFHLRATHNLDEEVVALARRTPIRKGEGIQGRMAVTRQPVQIPDIAVEDAYRGPLRDILLRTGTRALLAIPMLREDELIGGLTVNRKTPGAFAPEVIELLQTFATQSALAIQNARLFREIADKSRQLEAASRHKSEFLANMSHELRTPLNAIIGFSEVLAERMFGEVNEKQAEYLQDILASGRHLLSLINDILDLSKVEAGRLELELASFNLPVAVENALTLVRERATRHGISLAQAVDERVGDIVADERKVKQILLNLLSNAVKFTPAGGRIVVTATPLDGVIEISVSDTGIGIAPEDQAAVFEEFRQVGTSDAQRPEGTGLGLTLAKKFVELHGGRIGVRSQVGQGSTFTFTLPVQPERTSSSA